MGLTGGIARSRAVQGAFCWILARYIRFVYLTSRWQVLGRSSAEAMVAEGKPFIVAFWHGRLLMAAPGWWGQRPMTAMISRHRDGELITRTIRHLGVDAVRGSATRGGSSAVRGCVRALASGTCVAVTPDGPRGPRMRAQPGIITLARLARVPIIPATYAVSRRRLARSWDRFVFAIPLSRGVYLWGEPIHVPPLTDDATDEAIRLELETRLNELTEQADLMVGVAPVEPASVAEPRAAHREEPTKFAAQVR